jgi:hypothetical protein
MSNRSWIWILLILFAVSLASYPGYELTVVGWPGNLLFSVVLGFFYTIIYGLFIKDRLDREE